MMSILEKGGPKAGCALWKREDMDRYPFISWTISPKNSVPDGKFDKLEIDSEVCFVEKAGEKGPQAYIFKGCNDYNRSNQNIRQGAQEEPALFRGT